MTLSALFALILAIISACATPRAASEHVAAAGELRAVQGQPGAPQNVRADGSGEARSKRSDAGGTSPATESGAPQDASAVTWEGTLAYALPSFGPLYLAIRQPRGTHVVICGPAECVTRISTDFGPSPEMARQGRIADVSAADFPVLCGVPLAFGLCPGTLTLVGLPATSTK